MGVHVYEDYDGGLIRRIDTVPFVTLNGGHTEQSSHFVIGAN